MLGFVIKKINIFANTQKIEEVYNSDLDKNMHSDFQLVDSNNLTESYKCMYQLQSDELELRHIWGLFKCYVVVIETYLNIIQSIKGRIIK